LFEFLSSSDELDDEKLELNVKKYPMIIPQANNNA
jgi:hypothetical protein